MDEPLAGLRHLSGKTTPFILTASVRTGAIFLRQIAMTQFQTMSDGEKLLIERRRRGLAAWKLAAQAGIDPTTYSRIERGQRQATFGQKLALARALGVEPEQIFARVTA